MTTRIMKSWMFYLAGLMVFSASHFAAANDDAQAAKDAAVVETLLRLKGVNVNASPKLKEAVMRHLESQRGTQRYLDLVEKLKLKGVEDELVRLAVAHPEDNLGVRAAELLAKSEALDRLGAFLGGEDEKQATSAAVVLGFVSGKQANALLGPVIIDIKRPLPVRSAAARSLARNRDGQQLLLELVEGGKLLADLRFTVGNVLHSSADEDVRRRIAKHIQLPASAAAKPLPPIAELVKRQGDAGRGRDVFGKRGECIKCHKVAGEGKEVGPDLSEIGGKLSKEAMYVSILDPSAGISHNYESYGLLLADGTVHSGILVSETGDAVTIKTAEALTRTFAADDIEEMRKLPLSLMPADLQKNMSEQELVDVVEYLTTLKKASAEGS